MGKREVKFRLQERDEGNSMGARGRCRCCLLNDVKYILL